jgi:hypothetical protein
LYFFNFPQILKILLFPLFLYFLLLGCVQRYQPQSPWEAHAYQQTRDDLYPEDFRESLKKFKGEKVRWVGIIQESEFYDNPDNYEVVLLLEHRYFDWKVEKISSPDMLYPSKSGEGLFQTKWFLKQDADLNYFLERFGPGNLAIVYAAPDTVINKVVLVNSEYIRIIDPLNFQADQLDYIPDNRRNRSMPSTSYSK